MESELKSLRHFCCCVAARWTCGRTEEYNRVVQDTAVAVGAMEALKKLMFWLFSNIQYIVFH